MADFNEYKGVWVFCEQRQGALMSTDFELVSEARKLADELGLELVAPALNYSPNPPYTDPLRWMDEFVALVGTDAFDYVAVHNYGGLGWDENTRHRFPREVRQARVGEPSSACGPTRGRPTRAWSPQSRSPR